MGELGAATANVTGNTAHSMSLSFPEMANSGVHKQQQQQLQAINARNAQMVGKPSGASMAHNNGSKKHAHIIVQHNYHDHSHDSSEMYSEEHPVRGGVTTPFPLKLHEMLHKVESHGLEHIVSWQPHGRCFVVHKPQEFVQLLPNYFKLSKLASFQRQLNLYGFQRITKGYDKGGYYHELFLRNRMFMAHAIQRIKVKGTGVRARSNPAQEPDFWNMPWVDAASTPTGSSSPTNNMNFTTNNNSQPNMHPSAPATVTPQNTAAIFSPPAHMMTQVPSYGASTQPMMSFMPPPPAMAKATPTNPPQHSVVSSPSASSTEEDDDIVCTFGNRTFHALAIPTNSSLWQPLSTKSARTPQSQSSASLMASQSASVDAYTEFQESHGLIDEMEDFFQDFDFARDVSASIPNLDDDAVFGDVLEQIIA